MREREKGKMELVALDTNSQAGSEQQGERGSERLSERDGRKEGRRNASRGGSDPDLWELLRPSCPESSEFVFPGWLIGQTKVSTSRP